MPKRQEFEFDLQPGDEDPGEGIGRHRVVSSLPPWRARDEACAPAPAPPPAADPAPRKPLTWRDRIVESCYVAGAMVCFAAAIIAVARIHFLLEQDLLSLLEFAGLLAVAAGCALLGRLVVQALRARVGRQA